MKSSAIKFEETLSLEELKNQYAHHFVSHDQLRPPEGISTGIDIFDRYLLSQGIPKGEVSLLYGYPGTGASSLWLSATARLHQNGKWVAWVNSGCELFPGTLLKKKIQLDKLLVVKKPKENSQLFWILQELISSRLFEMVGCNIEEDLLKSHQLEKLKRIAREYGVALVFISHFPKTKMSSVYGLVIETQKDFFIIKKASHRPTPFYIPGGFVHADLMSQLTAEHRQLLR